MDKQEHRDSWDSLVLAKEVGEADKLEAVCYDKVARSLKTVYINQTRKGRCGVVCVPGEWINQ